MKSERAVTLMSLAIYIILIMITITILTTVISNFQNNIKNINEEGTEISEINKFNIYFLQEAKKQGNHIESISDSEVIFSSGNKYIFRDRGIYLENAEGTSINIANNIASCKFSTKIETGKTVIIVKIRPNNTNEKTNEYVLSNEQIASNYEDESNYINGLTRDVSLPDGWEITKKPDDWSDDETPIKNGENVVVPLPDGYDVSDKDGEHTIEEGLVIKDRKGNEFVWIPVSDKFEPSYKGLIGYSEPTDLTEINTESGAPQVPYDSQETLDYYYGTGYYNYKKDFAYWTHYTEMVRSVNKYKGFYIGRYETTINEFNEVGSRFNTTVLRANRKIPHTNNKECRWWGLYYSQRNSNVVGNKKHVRTNMIWGQQWDAMLKYFDKVGKDYSKWGTNSAGVVNSGQAINSSGAKDIIYNVYDLRTNAYDWIAESNDTLLDSHTLRGGYHFISLAASNRVLNSPYLKYNDYGSRLVLYLR